MARRFVLVCLLVVSYPLFAKSLHWTAIDVEARLDRDGNLHVLERQQMVFDGDWNGGERAFNLRSRLRVEVHRVSRIDGATEIPLERGNLDVVDHWDLVNGNIRWRSRLPSDPPFENQEITYLLDYTYSNILIPLGDGGYRINHDFGLPDRDGVIERFALRLDFDPVWGASPITMFRTDVPPGVSSVVTRDVAYRGEGLPAGVEQPIPSWAPIGAFAIFVVGVIFLLLQFVAGERTTGRFAPVPSRFDDEMLALPAEVAGAAWDAGIGAPEVAAVLARMAKEGKLSSRAEGKTLYLTLNVDRRSLPGYELPLVEKLFFNGRQETDTDAIRKHYRSSGFDPSGVIKPGIEQALERLPGWKSKVRRYRGGVDALLCVAALVTMTPAAFVKEDKVMALVAIFVGIFFTLFACIGAFAFSKRVTGFTAMAWTMSVLMLLPCIPFLVAVYAARTLGLHPPVLFGLALWDLALLNLMFDVLKIRQTPEAIAFRKRIAGARQYFVEQLGLPVPALRDEWFPYVVAFGLGANADRWFHAHGSSGVALAGNDWSSSSSSSGSGVSGWTGGGGAFGGAGATGSWAIAAGAIASGVAAPSSSSGGGGGGGSSGGGGGGGW